MVEYPVVSHAQAIEVIFPFDLFDTRRIGILGQRVDPPLYSPPYRSIEGLKVPLRPRRKLDPVSQLDAQLFLEFLPGHRAFFLHFRQRLARLFEVDLIL